MELQGQARLGKKTKDLVKSLKPKEIAIIDHQDLDAMGATGLVEAQVSAVINTSPSITGRYPNLGPQILLDNEVPLIEVDFPLFDRLHTGDIVTIKEDQILLGDKFLAQGRRLTQESVDQALAQARDNLDEEISKFVDNTITYVKKEKALILGKIDFPQTTRKIAGEHAVVVVRGLGYREDLQAISAYIDEMRPVLIGVDGGADALLEFGHTPDIIIGDMDSVSDKALHTGADILVHAYPDGRCPGKDRLEQLNLAYTQLPAPGTSEDIAMLLAYEKGAELVVAVGTHSNLIDFLEKGRPGMSSTFLTRMKIGPVLMDAKGVSKLYQGRSGWIPLPVVIAAFVPILVFLALSSPWRQLLRLLWLQIRVYVGGM